MKESFPIIPASNGPVWVAMILGVFMLVLVALFGYFAYSSRHVTFEVSPEGLQIVGGLYGRRIPMTALDVGGAKAIDMTRDRDYALTIRTNGAGLPGYSAGWFRIRKGEKALAFVTNNRRVVYLPTREGYSVLMSVAEPQRMLDALRRAGGSKAME